MLDKFQQSWFLLWKSLQSCSSCSSSPCRMCSVPRFSSSTECWTFQLGTSLAMHSAHCAQDRGVPQVQVLGMVLSACCCATTGAVADSARGCLVRPWIHILRLLGCGLEEFYIFSTCWRYSDPEVDPATCSPLAVRRSMHSRCFDC